jgi:acetoin utilization deacetylase AcuC-like enzyme
MSLVLVSSPRFAEHQTPPGHPESPARAEVMEVVAREWELAGGEVIVPRAATRAELCRVHDEDYLDRIAATSGRAVALDVDTYTSPESHEIGLLAAGAALTAVEQVIGASHRRAVALVRPPGHHAERSRAMGFCLYNNAAVAAAHARALGARRVAIVDYDVHHGNGTQHMFERESWLLYVSTHQHPEYPGTGLSEEIGLAEGQGFTVNLPLEAGAVDEDYRLTFVEVVVPIVRQFEPDLLIVSAGFDPHERDPLAGMRLTTPAFSAMTTELAAVADEQCEGRLVVVTEGGYSLPVLADSLRDIVRALEADGALKAEWPASTAVAPRRGRETIARARQVLSPFWTI